MTAYRVKAPIGTVKLTELLPLFDSEHYKNKVENIVCRGYFGRVKREGTSNNSMTFVPKEGAEKIRMLAGNLKNLEGIVVLSKAAEETKIPLQSLRHLIYSSGKQYTLYEKFEISDCCTLGYKKSEGRKKFVEPVVPYLIWVSGTNTNKYLTRGVTDILKNAIRELNSKEKLSFDGYWHYRLGGWIKKNKGLYSRKQKIIMPQEKPVKRIVSSELPEKDIKERLTNVFKCEYNWFGEFIEYTKEHGIGGAKVDWENLPDAKTLRIDVLKMMKYAHDLKNGKFPSRKEEEQEEEKPLEEEPEGITSPYE